MRVDDVRRKLLERTGNGIGRPGHDFQGNSIVFQFGAPRSVPEGQQGNVMAALAQSARPAARGLFRASEGKAADKPGNFHGK